MSISYTENIDLATFLVATGRLKLILVVPDRGRCRFEFLDEDNKLPLFEAEYLAGAAVPCLQFMGVYRQIRTQMSRAKRQALELANATERSI